MSLKQFIGDGDERIARRYRYDDELVIVADLGVPDDATTIEVLDDVVLIVIEKEDETAQAEIQLPENGDAQAFINNGVVTIEVST